MPRGGSSFTGSIDAVLCVWRDKFEDPIEIFPHSRKWRGPRFDPLLFELVKRTHPSLLDNFGDGVSTVVAIDCTPERVQLMKTHAAEEKAREQDERQKELEQAVKSAVKYYLVSPGKKKPAGTGPNKDELTEQVTDATSYKNGGIKFKRKEIHDEIDRLAEAGEIVKIPGKTRGHNYLPVADHPNAETA